MFPIRIKIWHKLFFAILLVVMLILAITMGLSRFSFQQGFTQYIEEVKLKRIDDFGQTLSVLYHQRGSWKFLEENPISWHQLLSEAELIPPKRRNSPEHSGGISPKIDSAKPVTFGKHRIPPPPFMHARIGLLDSSHSVVIGPPATVKDRRLPVEVEGQVVGYLYVHTFKPFRNDLEHQFARKQLESLLLTALVSLVIAIVASLLLARIFNQPIARLAVMARQLTSGQFESRAEVYSWDELGDLAADLNILAETLQKNQSARRQWIADISHELRTPLTVLQGEIEAIEDGIRPLNKESIQSLSLDVKQLKRLIDDLYQLSLSDQGSLSYEKKLTAPLELLQRVIESFNFSMNKKQITLTIDCAGDGPRLLADPQRLTQLFTNLLENSLRYTDEGGVVKIHCDIGSELRIHFEDSAPGVAQEYIPRLFERLFRVDDSRNRGYGGSGLGLSIVQSIARAHGGKLTAEPSTLGGLKISLSLPIRLKR